jgi:hypothetical protein
MAAAYGGGLVGKNSAKLLFVDETNFKDLVVQVKSHLHQLANKVR